MSQRRPDDETALNCPPCSSQVTSETCVCPWARTCSKPGSPSEPPVPPSSTRAYQIAGTATHIADVLIRLTPLRSPSAAAGLPSNHHRLSRSASPMRRPAAGICSSRAGQRGIGVPAAAPRPLAGWSGDCSGSVPTAGTRSRSRREPCCTAPAPRSTSGSGRHT